MAIPNELGPRRRPTDAEIDAETTPDVLAARARQAAQRWDDDGTAAESTGLNGLLDARVEGDDGTAQV